MKRENNLELLRVIASIMVITIHVSAFYATRYIENPNIRFTIGNLYDSFARPAVPIFVLLSGRFSLSDDKNTNYQYYYKKIFERIVKPTITWSFLYFLYCYILIVGNFIRFGKWENIFVPIKAWVTGAPFYHLWYLYMSIGLYLLVPYLLKLKKKIGEKNFLKLGILFFILGLIIYLFENYLNYINFYNRNDILQYLKYIWLFNQIRFIQYLGYFMLGYSLKNVKNKYTNFKNMILITILFLGILFLTIEILVRNKAGITGTSLYSNNFIFVMGASIFLYLAFNNLESDKIKINFSHLAFHSFNIYLVHAGILSVITILLDKILKYEPNPLWYIPFMICFIFISSYIFLIVLNKIIKKFKFLHK